MNEQNKNVRNSLTPAIKKLVWRAMSAAELCRVWEDLSSALHPLTSEEKELMLEVVCEILETLPPNDPTRPALTLLKGQLELCLIEFDNLAEIITTELVAAGHVDVSNHSEIKALVMDALSENILHSISKIVK